MMSIKLEREKENIVLLMVVMELALCITRDIISLSPSKPINDCLENITASLIKRKEREGATSGQIKVRTGG